MSRLLNTFAMWTLLMASPFIVLVAVNETVGPSHHRYDAGRCTRYCHDHGCPHVLQRYDFQNDAAARFAKQVYDANLRALGRGGLSYASMNLFVYVVLFPALAGLLLLGALWPLPARGGRS